MELWVSHEATLLLSYCLYILTARLCMHEYSRGGQSTHEWTTYSVTLHDEIKCETAQILKCTYRVGCARSSRERTKECKSAVEWYDGEIIANQTAIFQIENNNVFIIVIIWNSINTWVYLIEWLLYVFGIVSASSIAAFVHCRLVRFAFKFMSSRPLQYIFFLILVHQIVCKSRFTFFAWIQIDILRKVLFRQSQAVLASSRLVDTLQDEDRTKGQRFYAVAH